jgi:hypothetical protein
VDSVIGDVEALGWKVLGIGSSRVVVAVPGFDGLVAKVVSRAGPRLQPSGGGAVAVAGGRAGAADRGGRDPVPFGTLIAPRVETIAPPYCRADQIHDLRERLGGEQSETSRRRLRAEAIHGDAIRAIRRELWRDEWPTDNLRPNNFGRLGGRLVLADVASVWPNAMFDVDGIEVEGSVEWLADKMRAALPSGEHLLLDHDELRPLLPRVEVLGTAVIPAGMFGPLSSFDLSGSCSRGTVRLYRQDDAAPVDAKPRFAIALEGLTPGDRHGAESDRGFLPGSDHRNSPGG